MLIIATGFATPVAGGNAAPLQPQIPLFDEERCVEFDETGENPFDSEKNLILVSIDLLAKKPKRLQQALEVQWDMLIVDEAHHLIWEEHRVSKEYAAIEQLARKTPSVLLLTATPEQ